MPENYYTSEGADLNRLLSMGFSDNEAEGLIHMKNHVSDQAEYREIIAESRRLDFVRWLVEHDRIRR